MKIAVFGGTGATGQLLIGQALTEGHGVTAYARTPGKLVPSAKLDVVEGQIADAARVREAVEGADAVISLLGPGRDKASNRELAAGMRTIIDAMVNAGIKRLVATSTPSAPDPSDGRDLRLTAMIAGVRYGMPVAYQAIVDMAGAVRESSQDWTLVRLPLLHDGPSQGPARPRSVGQPGGLRLSRAALAAFLLDEAQTRRWVHQAPLLSDT